MRGMEQATAKTPGDESTTDPAGSSNTQHQHQIGSAIKKQQPATQKRRTERKQKALSPSKRKIRPSKKKSSTFEQKSKEAAIAQTKLALARKRQQQAKQRHGSADPHGLIYTIKLQDNRDNKSRLRLIQL